MSADFNLNGLVLQRKDVGESDRLLTLLTEERGKFQIYAKGARKAGSRLAGSTEPFTLANFQVAEGRYRNFLRQAQIINNFSGLRTDYDKLSTAISLAELTIAFTEFDKTDPDLFKLIIHALDYLVERSNPKLVLIWTGLKMMENEGVSPHWITCSSTQKDLEEAEPLVSPSAGGYVSATCKNHYTDVFRTKAEVLIALHKLSGLGEPPNNLKLTDHCYSVFMKFGEYIAHRSFKSFR